METNTETKIVENQVQQELGPRKMSFFTLVLKVLLGFITGIIGSMLLLLIFLGASSILRPVLTPAEATVNEISPLFIIIVMAMIFITSMVTSTLAPYFFSYTERDHYLKVTTPIYQIFIFNLVIFAFVSPIYLSTSLDRLELAAYAAGLHIVLSALSSSLIFEIMNDVKYSLLGVYSSVLGVLVSTAVNLFIYRLFLTPTVLLFVALPITWTAIGFFQGALPIFYNWYVATWGGNDFLLTTNSYGQEYGEQEEVVEEQLPEDKDGSDFLKK